MRNNVCSSKFPPEALHGRWIRDLSLPTFKSEGKVEGYRLPAFVDAHIHGAFGWDFSFGDPDRIDEMLDDLMGTGLTGVVATIISCSEKDRAKAIRDIVTVSERRLRPPAILGIHLEGPFLAPSRRGSHPEEFLMPPSISALEKWQQLAEGKIKIVTIAPELPGAFEFISNAKQMGIQPSIGHTNAEHSIALKAIALGADYITHFFNAMCPFKHREPTAVSAILGHSNVVIELISDTIHIAPEIINMMYTIFPTGTIVLVSDAVAPAGLDSGVFNLYGQKLELQNGRCTFSDGKLFGGGQTLLQNFASVCKKTKVPLEVLTESVSSIPANALRKDFPGQDVILSENFQWLTTCVEGTWYWFEK